MTEITAEMIERGAGPDPEEAARRRKAHFQMRAAREKLTAGGDRREAYDLELLHLFAQGRKAAMSEVIYTESCHAGLLCMALNLGNSFGRSLSVGVYPIKLNNLTKYVELPVECLRTRVQFPPPPPTKEKSPPFLVGFFLLV